MTPPYREDRSSGGARSSRRRALAALCLGASLAALGCSAGRDDPSLVWISLDTVRADHLQPYGYQRDTSAFLTELAERGLWFEWAISPQNSTLPTHLTQFTGIHPVVHGVFHSRRNPGIRLADSVRTLPEVLTDAGFRSRAFTDGGKMSRHYGFARGFEEYHDEPEPLPQKLRRVVEALDALAERERFFFFVHTYEAHAPYSPPRPYRGRYREADAPPPRRQSNLYDGSLRLIDDQLRSFVAELERRGLLETTLLVITSDHGESFSEYGIAHVGHAGENLHQNLTRVPWIVLHPSDRHRGKVSEPVGLVDFANTTLALLGVEERLPGQGVDVLAADAPADRAYVSWTGHPTRPDCAWSLYAGGYHLLQCDELPGPERNGLYDVRSDPLERSPLDRPDKAAELADRLTTLRRELEEQKARLQPSLRDFGPLEEKTLEQLRALGYLGGNG